LEYPWTTGPVSILEVSMDNQAYFYSWSIYGQSCLLLFLEYLWAPGLLLFLEYPWTTRPVSILGVFMGTGPVSILGVSMGTRPVSILGVSMGY
jgi:hypothetical protein